MSSAAVHVRVGDGYGLTRCGRDSTRFPSLPVRHARLATCQQCLRSLQALAARELPATKGPTQ